METLAERASSMREALQKSRTITDNMVSILGSFDHRLSALEAAMRPTQVRTYTIRMALENIDKTLKASDGILAQFDVSRKAEMKILRGPHEDLESYLEAVEQLRNNIRFFTNNKSLKSSDGVLSHANGLLAKAMLKLEEEFKQMLSSYSKPVEPDRLFDGLPSALRLSSTSPGHQRESSGRNPLSSSGHSEHPSKSLEAAVYKPPTLIPPRTTPLLHDLAFQLVQAGFQQECSIIYREARAPALQESLRKLGVEKLTRDDVQKMQWEVLEAQIGNWIHFIRIAVKLLFASERNLCNQIFDDIDTLKEQSFAQVTSSSLKILLSFGEAVAQSKRAPEKLFVLLDMYDVMCEMQSEIEEIFKGNACSEMRGSAMNLTNQLAQSAQETFGVFEEAVEKDVTKTIVHDGTVHPLTSYVINYVKFLLDSYQSTLKQLFLKVKGGDENNSELSLIVTKIMQVLQTNLEVKSRQCEEPALTQLFLMNNIHYMVKSVRRSEAKDLLGDDWVQRHRRIVQQHANQYRRIAWGKILQCVSAQGLTSSVGSGSGIGDGGNSSGTSKAAVKERFKIFNFQFEKLHQKQSQWTVPDAELRESLRLAVAEVLLPAYRSFLKRFGNLVESGKNPQKYIRYTPEDLDQILAEFFEGKTSEVKR